MADGADLLGLGEHCEEPSCNLVDFLPFRCDCCKRTYCLEHRTYAAHRCEAAGQKQGTTIVCPLCAKAIKVAGNEDVMVVFDRHTVTDCDPANYARVHRKPRCPVPGCKEKLTATNTYRCKECCVDVCLKHRFGKDHRCSGKPEVLSLAAAARQKAAAALRSALGSSDVRDSSGSSSSRVAAGQGTPASVRQQGSQPASAGVSSGPAPVASPAQPRSRSATQPTQSQPEQQQQQQPVLEVCMDCGAAFPSVSDLIQHCEAHHQGGAGGMLIETGRFERCPQCGLEFSDAVSLVEHVERQHASSNTSTCVVS